jgi:hypothetical protein
MSEGFDPFAPGAAMFTGRPFRATRAARGEEEGDSPKEGGRGPGPAEMDERLAEMEGRLVLIEESLAQLERKVAARMDEQMARIILAVAELLGMRGRAPDTSSGCRSVRAHPPARPEEARRLRQASEPPCSPTLT